VIKPDTLLKILTYLKYVPASQVRLGLADAFSLRDPIPNFRVNAIKANAFLAMLTYLATTIHRSCAQSGACLMVHYSSDSFNFC
jgi:hypothetical protein